MTNNDADQLYDRPTVIQLIQMDRGSTDTWGCFDLGGYICLGAYGCMGVYRHRGHMDIGGIQT